MQPREPAEVLCTRPSPPPVPVNAHCPSAPAGVCAERLHRLRAEQPTAPRAPRWHLRGGVPVHAAVFPPQPVWSGFSLFLPSLSYLWKDPASMSGCGGAAKETLPHLWVSRSLARSSLECRELPMSVPCSLSHVCCLKRR